MTDEEIKKELDACYAAKKQIEEDFLKAKQVFKEKGEYKGDFCRNTWQSKFQSG